MITKEEKKAVVKAIGKNYISKIYDFAKANDRKKENGDLYSKSFFTMVLGGNLTHEEGEKIIFDASEYYLELEKQEQQRRKEFVQKVSQSA